MTRLLSSLWAAWAIYQIIQTFRQNPTHIRIAHLANATLAATTAYYLSPLSIP